MGSTWSGPVAYLQKHGWPMIGIPASLEMRCNCCVKFLKCKHVKFGLSIVKITAFKINLKENVPHLRAGFICAHIQLLTAGISTNLFEQYHVDWLPPEVPVKCTQQLIVGTLRWRIKYKQKY